MPTITLIGEEQVLTDTVSLIGHMTCFKIVLGIHKRSVELTLYVLLHL